MYTGTKVNPCWGSQEMSGVFRKSHLRRQQSTTQTQVHRSTTVQGFVGVMRGVRLAESQSLTGRLSWIQADTSDVEWSERNISNVSTVADVNDVIYIYIYIYIYISTTGNLDVLLFPVNDILSRLAYYRVSWSLRLTDYIFACRPGMLIDCMFVKWFIHFTMRDKDSFYRTVWYFIESKYGEYFVPL